MGRPRKLTPVEEAAVCNMYLNGQSITEIAYLNKISVRTVSRILKINSEEEKKNDSDPQ